MMFDMEHWWSDNWWGEKEVHRQRLSHLVLSSPEIPHWLPSDSVHASVVKSWQLWHRVLCYIAQMILYISDCYQYIKRICWCYVLIDTGASASGAYECYLLSYGMSLCSLYVFICYWNWSDFIIWSGTIKSRACDVFFEPFCSIAHYIQCTLGSKKSLKLYIYISPAACKVTSGI
jgi:hypothetical protein